MTAAIRKDVTGDAGSAANNKTDAQAATGEACHKKCTTDSDCTSGDGCSDYFCASFRGHPHNWCVARNSSAQEVASAGSNSVRTCSKLGKECNNHDCCGTGPKIECFNLDTSHYGLCLHVP